jgi:hypothetical protein
LGWCAPGGSSWLDELRDRRNFALFGDRDVHHHVQHLVDHRVELVVPDTEAIIEATREFLVLISLLIAARQRM